jgi:hypothetical protein
MAYLSKVQLRDQYGLRLTVAAQNAQLTIIYE